MKKEFFKTVILTLLVISSLVLSANIWYEKELWSVDYSSFVYSLKNIFKRESTVNFSDTKELLEWCKFSPEFISFTYGSQKMIVYDASPDFPGAYQTALEILSSLEKEGEMVSVTDEEYLNSYKTNSMMLKFPSDISLSELLKKEDAFFDLAKEPLISTLVVGIDDSQTNYLSFLDVKSGHAYRMPVKTNAVTEQIRQKIEASGQNASFAFELNFDRKQDEAERILFHRFVPISLGEHSLRGMRAEPVLYSSQYDGVFKAFHIVKNSARTYRDKENTIHFIENRSTLKIREQGAFLFEATEQESGIVLGEEADEVIEFVNLLYQELVPQSDAFLALCDEKTEGDQTKYAFLYRTKNGAMYLKDSPAVLVTVKNGAIMKYEQQLYNVTLTGGADTTTGVIEAYDFLYNQPDFPEKSKLSIKSMQPCHILSDGQMKAGWACIFSDRSHTFFIP
ncbi:MAG: hypothetical protein J6K51_01450 [Clostridia bacterium]|nr:hypothetical protein [Clostridia bacterium]